MSAEQNKEIVTDFFKEFSASEYDAALELMAEDGTWWIAGSIPISGTMTKAEFAQFLGGVGEMIEGPLIVNPYAMTAEGERVAVEAASIAEHVNGMSYRNEYHFLFVIKNGKISEVKEYFDTMHANDVLCT